MTSMHPWKIAVALVIVSVLHLILAVIFLATSFSHCAGFAIICICLLMCVISISIFCYIIKGIKNSTNKGGLLAPSQGSLTETALVTEDEKPLTILKSEGLHPVDEERPCSPSLSIGGRVVSTPHGTNPKDKDDARDRKISAGSQAGDSAVLIQVSPDPRKSKPKEKKRRVKRGSRASIELAELRRPGRGLSYGHIHNEETK
ncbi:uncharacterized protein LOC119723112 [Patiria miniata]|uniref:Uncharacterized protein n=1 Tax=Patiria miniata TaxID=46514 RepID=A0A913ZCR5_PATMI|nr:uncharacterized protein LOC119723112 [Patiria miniata]